jgi:hypothetical protein
MNKALIFDSSSIITLAMNDLLYILEPLKKRFGGEFYITEDVKREVIDKPFRERRFMLDSLFIKKLLEKGVLTLFSNLSLNKERDNIMLIANHTFRSGQEDIRMLHEGESSCLGLFNLLDIDKKAIVVDERTTRILCEAPENMRKLLESKLHTKIDASEKNYPMFKDFRIFRSSELVFIAYRLGIIDLPAKKRESMEALLYGLKYKGCTISMREIDDEIELA